MSDVQNQDERWKAAWIEFLIEMVAMDSTEGSAEGEPHKLTDSVMREATEIERSISRQN